MSRRHAETLARHLDTGAPSGDAPAEVQELAALARAIEARAVAPRPQFRADLRAMLLAEAATPRPPAWRQRLRGFVEDALAGLRTTGRQVTAAGLAAVVLIVAGLGAATSMAVPGEFLHTVKLRLEDQRIERAETLSQRGTLLLQSASNRVGEAERSAATDRPASAQLALEAADARTRDGAQALLSAALTSGDRAPVAALERFTADQRPRVEALAGTLAGDPGQAARDLLTTLERIDARIEALAGGCCAFLTGFTHVLADLTVIPPAGQPFHACPCVPAGTAAEADRLAVPGTAELRDSTPLDASAATARQREAGARSDGGGGSPAGASPDRRPAAGIAESVGRAAEEVSGTVEEATDAVDGATKKAGDDAGGVTQTVTGAADDAREPATGALEEAGTATEAVSEAAADGAGVDAQGTVDDVEETVEDTVDDVEDVEDAIGGLLP